MNKKLRLKVGDRLELLPGLDPFDEQPHYTVVEVNPVRIQADGDAYHEAFEPNPESFMREEKTDE